MNATKCVCASLGVWALAGLAVAEVVYVNRSATPGGGGTSWADAYASLQTALTAARADPDITEIRVAEGRYKPGTGEEDTFALVLGVTIQGGYSADGSGALDPGQYRTVLTGRLSPSVQARHVVTVDLDGWTTLRGVVVSDGYAPGERGAGVLVARGGLQLINATISQNWANEGGAMAIGPGASAYIEYATFSENTASRGGALHFDTPDAVWLLRSTVRRNTATDSGGGIWANADFTVFSTVFQRNVSNNHGGAVYIAAGQGGFSPTLLNATLVGNGHGVLSGTVCEAGGGIYAESIPSGQVSVRNSILWDNVAEIRTQFYGDVGVFDSDVMDISSHLVHVSCFEADPEFENPAAGNLRLRIGSPCIGVGDNEPVTAAWWAGFDRDADDRIQSVFPSPLRPDVVDLGAYERGPIVLARIGERGAEPPPPTAPEATDPGLLSADDAMAMWARRHPAADVAAPFGVIDAEDLRALLRAAMDR